MNSDHPPLLRLLPGLVVLLPLLLSLRAGAQASPTDTRLSELAAFAEGQILHPDYKPTSAGFASNLDKGLVLGVNYTRFFHAPVLPSFEVRGTYAAKGPVAGEETALLGARFDLRHGRFDRLDPYANFLVGVGQINFTHPGITSSGPYTHDNSIVYNYGGGLDFQVSPNFSAQAEFQYQRWNLGTKLDPDVFSPYAVNIGVRYRIPFGRRSHL